MAEAVKGAAKPALPKKVNPIHYIIVFAFCFFFRFIPGFAGITPLGMGVLGAFIGAIYGWIAIGMFWPSIVALAGVGLSIGMTNMFTAGFGSMVVIAMLFCMPIIYVCNDTGAFEYIIDKTLSSKALHGKPWATVLVLFLVAWLFSCVNIAVVTMIVVDFALLIFEKVGIEKNSKESIFILLGISYAAMVGQVMFPFMGMGLILLGAFNTMFPDVSINYAQYMLFMIPVSFLMVASFLFFMKFVFRVDVSKIAAYEPENAAMKATKDQKKALVIFLVFVVLAIWGGLKAGVVGKFLATLTLVGILFAVLAVMGVMHREDGREFCDMEAGMRTNGWGLITMVAFIMVMSSYFNKSETGIPAAISAMLQPFSSLPPFVFIVAILLVALILTNVANNLVITVLIMPIMFSYTQMIGMNPTGVMALLFIMTQFALITPAASVSTAVCMSTKVADAPKMTVAALKIIPLLFIVGVAIGWLFNILVF